ncbi:MAG: DNA repair exonuclease [Candidatus Nitronauta litoralis]|uniref:DNA repair exonuclease n=1 Tax=Candidatus Nitronauta litoralis TaxID=2705533 RepID=A0A7T0BVT7_9BACT|nr:MAG: DNA repair exonuclease [Candidatus Nitronauta litoralis]
MNEFRFIHCSDLHIDSPFKGIMQSDSALAAKLREGTSKAWLNIVKLALKEKVDAVFISGDIFDGADRSLRAQFKFREGLSQLSQAGIPSFIVNGNHDPLDSWSRALSFPEGVTVFSGEQVECFPVIKDGRALAQIYGISFPQRDVQENLAKRFKVTPRDGFNIGLLHANVGGNTDHDSYAPCNLDDLKSDGMDYWALGHIHKREVLSAANPAVVYCGNSQARHFKEAEPKGCCLVTLREKSEPDIEFVATDAVRFSTLNLDLTGITNLEKMMQAARDGLQTLMNGAGDRSVVLRLLLTGRTGLRMEWQQDGALADIASELADSFGNRELSIELVDHTRGLHNLEALREGKDFFADLISLYDETLTAPEDELRDVVADLFSQWKGKAALDSLSEEDLKELLEEARDLTLDRLHLTDEVG